VRAGKAPVHGRSMLALMGLVADQGVELEIEVSGDGATEALCALLDVFKRNFEDEAEA
jgi:phosphotransferase system HPr-like phosphotransfer protein